MSSSSAESSDIHSSEENNKMDQVPYACVDGKVMLPTSYVEEVGRMVVDAAGATQEMTRDALRATRDRFQGTYFGELLEDFVVPSDH